MILRNTFLSIKADELDVRRTMNQLYNMKGVVVSDQIDWKES